MTKGISSSLLLPLQLVAYWPVWRWYATRITDASDEPWGIVSLATALLFLLVHARSKELTIRQAIPALMVSTTYLASYHMAPPLIRAILAITALALTVAPLLERRCLHFGVFGLLILSLPVIASLQFYLGYPVRLLTAAVSSELISLTGYPTASQGTSLIWAGEVVAVDAPCAGIRMLWCGLYLAFTLACFSGLKNLETWFLYSVSLFVIFSGNVIRNTLLFYVESGLLAAPDWAHTTIGVVVFTFMALSIITIHTFIHKKGRLICVS
jgi:exosortase/archaeosortase family protein